MFGLGVDLDHTFGSKWLVDQLARLGFSVSSDEVKLLKQSVLEGDSDSSLQQYFPGSFVQWIADNVDHNIVTLDGKGTFHGMGIVASSTASNNSLQSHVIK